MHGLFCVVLCCPGLHQALLGCYEVDWYFWAVLGFVGVYWAVIKLARGSWAVMKLILFDRLFSAVLGPPKQS